MIISYKFITVSPGEKWLWQLNDWEKTIEIAEYSH